MNILLIRLRMIGDVVFTTPAVRALRRRFPEARLTYLVEHAAAPVVAGNPHIDEVIAVPLTSGVARVRDDWRIGRDLRRRRRVGHARIESRRKRHIEFRFLGQSRIGCGISRLKQAAEPHSGRNHQVIDPWLQMSEAIMTAVVRYRLLRKRGLS